MKTNICSVRFGGSAAVTSLKPCQVCLAASRAEQRQRQFELSEFQLLRENDKLDLNTGGDSYLLVTSWFSTWEAWVLGKAREPPGKDTITSIYIKPLLRIRSIFFRIRF